MASRTFQHKLGQTLDRWCQISTCMIEKKPGVIRIDKLRVIHLYEADYNLLLKIMWARRSVWHMVDKKAINNGQVGSRPGHRAIDLVLQKEMMYTYAHLTRTNLGTIDNDATSCYDQILCSLAMSISQYYGMPKNICNVQANTLERSKFKIRTALGDSSTTYQHSTATPIFGTGQGSSASPSIWLMQSSFIMDIYDKMAQGMTMISVNTKKIIKKCIGAFVDDASQFTNTEHTQQEVLVLQQALKHDAQTWSGLLAAISGKIEITKSFYYILSWAWDKYGIPKPQQNNQQDTEEDFIVLENSEGTEQRLHQRNVEECHKTLGVYKALSGNEKEHVAYLKDKSNQIALAITSGQLNQRQAKLAYNTSYIPSLLYSLPAVSLSENTVYTIQQKALAKFLQLIGFEEKFPRAVVFGPTELGGINLPQLYTQSICIKTEALSCHVNADSQLGTIFQIVVTWQQIQCGTSSPYLEDPDPITYINSNWFTHVKEFCNQVRTPIYLRDLWVPKLLREHDIILMDIVRYLPIPPIHKKGFNNWRLYFQANTLSNITNNSGTKIEEVYFKRREVINFRSNSTLNWPIQQQPSLCTFRIWVNTLRMITNFSDTGELHQHLGAWTAPPTSAIRSTTLIHKNKTNMVSWNYTRQQWRIFSQLDTRYGTLHFNRHHYHTSRSIHLADYVPVDWSTSDESFIIHSRTIAKTTYLATPAISEVSYVSYEEFRNSQQEKWYNNLLNNLSFHNLSQHEFHNDNQIVIGSDGGLQNNSGSYGAVLAINNVILLSLNGRVPNNYNTLTPHRCEAYGVLSAIVLYAELSIYIQYKYDNRIKIANPVICCDNEALIKTLNKWKNRETSIKFHYAADADIIKQILVEYKSLRRNNIIFTFRHVRGHQDLTGRELNSDEILNVEADSLATAALRFRNLPRIDLPSLKSTILINGLQVTSNHTTILRDLFTSIKLRKHLQESNNWDHQTMSTIWWKPSGAVLASCSPGEQKTIIKYLHKRWACNRKENRYYGFISPFCKLCDDFIECQEHILQCPKCVLRQQSRDTYLTDLRRYMEATHTNSLTCNVIITHLTNWLNNDPQQDMRTIAPEASFTIQQAVTEQTRIGWDHWFKGRISTTWGVLYGNDLQVVNHNMRNQTPDSWAKQLVEITWKFVLRNWTIRNDLEHDTNGDSELNKRNRLIAKILWNKGRIVNFPNNYLMRLTQEQIKDLPIANLKMMDSQIQALRSAVGRATVAQGN
jgi:Reverse transcriptase (RNA-dependent DNA polymerase)